MSCVRVKGGARFSLSKRAVDVDWDAGRACHLPVPHHGRARRFEARGAIAAVLGQIWRWVLPGVRRVDAGEAVRGRCLRDGCQHPSRVRGVRGSRGSRLGLVLHCLARAAAAAGSPQLRGTPRRWVRLSGGVAPAEARNPTVFAVFARRRRRRSCPGGGGGLGQPRKRFVDSTAMRCV